MKANQARIAWNPGTDQVVVSPLVPGWADGYSRTGGACYAHIANLKADSIEAKLMAYIEAFHMIVRDLVDPEAVFREFYKIDEFRDGLSYDFPTPSELPHCWESVRRWAANNG